MTHVSSVFDEINTIGSIFIMVLTFVFGDYWMLFVGFLLLNIADYVTGLIKSRLAHNVNSVNGLNGILKKLSYWIMIMLSFGMGVIFMEIGKVIHVNLQVTTLLGWFVLASLIMNECRSIIENFVEAGFKVPKVLSSSLKVANEVIENLVSDTSDDEIEDDT